MAASLTVSCPSAADVAELAANMRQADRDEIAASHGGEAIDVVSESVRASSESWALRINGRLACIWGVVPIASTGLAGGRGVVWMLTTSVVERFPVAFWRFCRDAVRDLVQRWAVLVNMIDLRHEKAVRWAERLGFAFAAPVPVGPDRVPFVPFVIVREVL